MKKFFRSATLLLFCLLAVGTADAKEKVQKNDRSLYQQLDLFTKVLELVRENYVENVNDKELMYGAIRGMLSTVDPHTLFMPPEVYNELKVDTQGRFGGVGLEITSKDNVLTVITPIEGSPAEKAGIKEGDKILKIDTLSTRDMPLSDAVNKMRGSRGSRVHLVLLHEGSKKPYEVTLTRDIIRLKSVRYELLDDDYGYIRITSFQEGTTEELRRALQALKDAVKKKSNGSLKGLVIDLRNNPGGLLDEAVSVSDLFLDSGTIVTTKSRTKEIDRRTAIKEGTEPDYPIVVLVNGGSASAAEIVAGALQDHKRATLLGTQTFGKGSVQTIFDLGDGAGLKLTIAKYYTPRGRSIQAEGITPDIQVNPKNGAAASHDRYIREKDLKGHLASEKKAKNTKSKTVNEDEASEKSDDEPETQPDAKAAPEDFQKKAAINYLKGLK
jgi:carboxyl-terminal processing protease